MDFPSINYTNSDMKKITFFVLATLVVLFGLTSCGDEALDVETVNKQTILVFLPWTGSSYSSGLYEDFENNLDSIANGIKAKKGLSGSRVLVFISRPKGNTNTFDKSYLYELKYDASNQKVEPIELNTYEGNSYASAEGIAQVLRDMQSKAEALNYALIIGGHGCGWTYYEDWYDYPNNAKGYGVHTTLSVPFEGWDNHPVTRFFGSVSSNDYAMDVTTLAKGIQASGIPKLQYILFDACYMGNVETAYELRNVTNYLIASSSEVMAAGMPYTSMWTSLNSSAPNYSGIVSSFYNFYSSYESPYGNLAAIDCRQLEKLASIMKEINTKYPTIKDEKLAGVQILDGFKPTLSYDLGNYVDSLVPEGLLKEQFNNQLKLTVKSAQSTPQVFSALYYNNYQKIDVKTYSGLSISDPSSNPVALRGREKTAWWQATH